MRNMKTGIQLPFNDMTSPDYIAAAGQLVEELGFDTVWVPEHVVFFQHYASRYPYAEGGKLPGDPRSLIDPFMALTFVAANTSRIRLGTGICIVPQRNPLYCAKQVADLDYLSGGRFDFGIGVGWLKEEFEALGVPWEGRGARTDEYLAIMRALWCEAVSSHDGELFQFAGVYQNPKPVQQPHPPVIVGGDSNAALARVARAGQGWYAYNVTPAMLRERLGVLAGLLADQGRELADVGIYVTPERGSWSAQALSEFAELGVAQVVGGAFARDLDKLKLIAGRLLEQVGR